MCVWDRESESRLFFLLTSPSPLWITHSCLEVIFKNLFLQDHFGVEGIFCHHLVSIFGRCHALTKFPRFCLLDSCREAKRHLNGVFFFLFQVVRLIPVSWNRCGSISAVCLFTFTLCDLWRPQISYCLYDLNSTCKRTEYVQFNYGQRRRQWKQLLLYSVSYSR